MDRRHMLGLLGAGIGMATATSAGAAMQGAKAAGLDSVHKECLEACGDCARACDMAYHHCLTMVAEGKKEHAKPLQYAADCAGFCALSACNIAKHSPLMAHSCEACGEACRETLAVLSKFDSAEMKAAVKSLTRCEASCTEMVKAMGHHH